MLCADSNLAPAVSVLSTEAAQDGNATLPVAELLLQSGAISARPSAAEAGLFIGSIMTAAAGPMVQISTATGGVYLPPPPPPVRSLEEMEAEQAQKAKEGAPDPAHFKRARLKYKIRWERIKHGTCSFPHRFRSFR